MKKLSIFLAFVMLFTMIPMTALAADDPYQIARDNITFETIKGSNVSAFDITSALNLPATAESDSGTTHKVEWNSSNPAAISDDGQTITKGAVDQWVTMLAKVYHEDVDNHADTYVTKTFNLRVIADETKVGMLFEDDFEGYTKDSELTATAKSDDSKWYIAMMASSTAYTDSNTTFTYTEDDRTVTGQAFKLVAKSAGKNNFATAEIANVPTSGLVSYSVDVLSRGSSTLMVAWPFWHTKTYNNFTYPVGNGASTYAFQLYPDRWYNVTTIFDLDTDQIDTYIDGVYAFGCVKDVSSSLGKIQLRLSESYPNDYMYVDNIEVKTLLTNEKTALAAVNPATKGGIYVDKNLATTVTLEGISYPVTYESSDESIIASDGTVTLPDFFSTVTVIPKVEIGGTVISGTATSLTVLPATYEERLFEDFDSITGVAEGDFFNADGSSKYTDWTQNATTTNYETAQTAGNRTQLVKDNGNFVLNMLNIANSKDYRVTKSIQNPECGDRVALSMRVKNIGNGPINLSSPYMGRFDKNYGVWRGDFMDLTWGDTNYINTLPKNEWLTLTFVYDTGISETKSRSTTVSSTCLPITLYINGELYATAWRPDKQSTGVNFYDPSSLFELTQFGADGTSDIYVDDILLVNLDAEDIQFAGATVADGKITNVELQYTSYGASAISGTVFAGAYDADGKLINVGVLGTVSAPAAGFHDLDVTDYALPEGTASYRLFLFDSVEGLRPLAVSKTYALQ